MPKNNNTRIYKCECINIKPQTYLRNPYKISFEDEFYLKWNAD